MDRISFYTLATSEDIRHYIRLRGYTPWDCHVTISREVHKYAEEVRVKIRADLHQKAQQGVRFSVTTDEYTSLKITRYCCVNIHLPGEHIPLGMIRVTGSLTAERAKEILEDKLRQFEIEDGHLVATTADGASVMKKMGRLLDMIFQVCHAHGKNLNTHFICGKI